ncbi:Vesicle-associated membrane protein 3 [Merluccius polli]|uniref:Vesicle-associated membrane protein 3 n=1 Tax=Merluccius polli TaxID=89951 RepID=A0AA47N009_MERPO|nr:Vesicle-associated membrane protein 3 [Merluccius polli]
MVMCGQICYSTSTSTTTTTSYRSNPNPGPEGSGAAQGNRRLQQTQAQVDEVVDIMRVNVDKVLERDQKLSELDDRADALQAGASQFETSAAKLKRKYWWKNCKMWAILIAVLIIIVIIIVTSMLLCNMGGHVNRRGAAGIGASLNTPLFKTVADHWLTAPIPLANGVVVGVDHKVFPFIPCSNLIGR